MHYLQIMLTAMLTLNAAASNILPRSFTSIKKGQQQIQTDEIAFTSAVNAFDGTTANFPKVSDAAKVVDKDVRLATADWNKQGSLTAAQCDTIVSGYYDIYYDVDQTQRAFVTKKPQFLPSFKTQVLSIVRNLQADYQTMMQAACGICQPLNNQCSLVASYIYGAWDNVIVEYTQCAKCTTCSRC